MITKSTGQFVRKESVSVPDGVYDGTWGGYHVEMNVNGQKVEFHTESGVRGMNIPVTVTVTNGVAEVKTR